MYRSLTFFKYQSPEVFVRPMKKCFEVDDEYCRIIVLLTFRKDVYMLIDKLLFDR
jgi:hypothetical protein